MPKIQSQNREVPPPMPAEPARIDHSPGLTCAKCSNPYEAHEKFCGYCGNNLQAQQETAANGQKERNNVSDEEFFS